jgi:hypothetical protein
MPRIIPRICAAAEKVENMAIINNDKKSTVLLEDLCPCTDEI